ncbi:autotransporter assembly complex protein TamA [Natronospira bacteriovora]|uniref:Translocation and assembly module subunit TamA n=1 Tax=Natronospira bacteriovora TaxID=3069753 RepID=A0ABU0W702_9GAMM|nr:autotransporter assembly complex family protein [Natronospira sp. AB-CW4]MDQ2069698.1 autotransporter assembly complex family protein [Natronospira sp. AB-CW4]
MRAPSALLPILAALLLGPGIAHAQSIEIEILGLDEHEEARENVLGTLSVFRYRDDSMGEPRLRRLHARAGSEIRQALRPFGYYAPETESEIEAEEEGWRLRYRITPGPRVQLTQVIVRIEGDGADDRAFMRALQEMPIRENQPLNHQHYEDAKSTLLAIADRRGYIEARWEQRSLLVDPETLSARAILILDSGPRYRFGPVTIHQDILSDSFVQRYVRFEEGEPFDADRLLGLQYGLSDSEYFNFVQVTPQRDQADEDRRIPIDVEVSERPKHRYTASIGYGTDTGPRYGLGWDYRRINQYGHRGALGYSISDVRRATELRYIVPLDNPVQERLVWDLNTIREDRGDFLSRRNEFGVGRTTVQWNWLQTVFLRYERERSIFDADNQPVSEIVVPGVTWSRTRANDPTFPRRGLSLSLDVRGAREEFLSDLNFFQTTLRAKRVQPAGEDNRFLIRLELGGTGTENFDRLPLSQRFFTGGDQSVRGFAYQELSPVDDDGRRVGGRYLAVSSVEFDRRLSGQWYGAAFVDAGNAMMSFSESLETSAGVGVRWASPIGMIRMDVARPLSDPDRGWRFHLTVGPDL